MCTALSLNLYPVVRLTVGVLNCSPSLLDVAPLRLVLALCLLRNILFTTNEDPWLWLLLLWLRFGCLVYPVFLGAASSI